MDFISFIFLSVVLVLKLFDLFYLEENQLFYYKYYFNQNTYSITLSNSCFLYCCLIFLTLLLNLKQKRDFILYTYILSLKF